MNADPQFIASLSPAFADALQNVRHALLTDDPAQSLASVLATFHDEHRAELLREAEEICDEAGASYTDRALNEQAAGAYELMARFRRKAEEAEQTASAPAAGGVVSAAPDRADLRQRIAAKKAEPAFRDAAKVLEAPVDIAIIRAAVLREAAELVTGFAADHFPDEYDEYADRLADELRRVAAEAQQQQKDGTETRDALMRAHVALAEQAGRDQAALARVRQLHDRLAEETDLTSPDDPITRGVAAKRIAAALDGWTPPAVSGPRAADDKQDGAQT